MKIAAAQINPIAGNIEYNSKQIEKFSAKAKREGASIVVFPELALPGGFAKDLYLRKDFLQACQNAIVSLSKKLDIAAFIGTVYNGENALVLVKGGKIIHAASKINYPQDLRYFKNNDIMARESGLSFCIYSDKTELEKAAKKATERKNEILLVSANQIFYLGRTEELQKEISECALKYKINILFVNMTGAQDGILSCGSSFAVSKYGSKIFELGAFEESVAVTNFSMAGKSAFKKNSGEKQAYDALVTGLRDYAVKNGFKKIVLGVSGGVDSALVAVIAKDALGSENVTGIFMPSEFTSQQSKDDSVQLCSMNGIKLLEIPITQIFESFKNSLSETFAGMKEDLTEENLQSRVRGTLLMAYSNKMNALVVTTGNKSETAAGYCTLYGDSAGGYGAISDLPKTFLYKVCDYRNSLSPSIPESILKRAPTAELRANQKDSDSLPEYNILDGIVEKYFDVFAGAENVSLSEDEKKIFAMINRAEYKRQQMPLGTKISKKSFGSEIIRIPVTDGYKEI